MKVETYFETRTVTVPAQRTDHLARHLRALEDRPASKATRRFLAQQRAAYRRADAALLRRTEALIAERVKEWLRREESRLLAGGR